MDLAIGLWAFGISRWRASDPWLLIQEFAAGYRKRKALTPMEIDAIPTLVRLREATSLIHWIGRFRQGLTNERDIEQRANRLLSSNEWIRTHDSQLIRRLERVTF